MSLKSWVRRPRSMVQLLLKKSEKAREHRAVHHDLVILGCVLLGDRYVMDIQQRVHVSLSVIYVALARLERQGLVEAEWDEEEGQLARKGYYLTDKALAAYLVESEQDA